jgi:hypothetical protein
LSSQSADPPVHPEVAAVAREVDRLIKQTGKTPKQIVTAAGNTFSEATVSRCRHGRKNTLPSDEMLAALFNLAVEPDDGRRRIMALVAEARAKKAAARDGGGAGPTTRATTSEIKRPRIGGIHGWWVALAALAAAVTAFAVFAPPRILGDDVLPDASGAPPAGSTAAPNPPTSPSLCDRYEVNAGRDLSIRDEFGTVSGQELSRGQQLTILSRRSPTGPPTIWQVRTDDGLTGWVDYHYLRPLCSGA